MQPLTLRSFARAILHIDADAFFASCEQAVNPTLKGKPVVTGKERGIASAVSYEAKACGVKRGMTIREIQQLCPDAIHLPSDYETYSLFSQRMFAIVRRYTPDVEEYSIDECFCDLTGLRRPLRMSYETMAARIKADLEHNLGLTFAVGLAPTKVVAKLASKWQKPAGLTIIRGTDLHLYLDQVPIENVWGIGPQTMAYLTRFGIATALDFARQDELWVRSKLTKPHQDIWHELRGTAVIPLEFGEHHAYQSISKTKTFTPPTSDREMLLAQLSKNVENACIKARRHHLEARRVSFFLRTQDFRHTGV
jgi:DNA polymerase-4